MKKVLIIYGYRGIPNGAWRPWLMTELEKKGIYATTLPMPGFDNPDCSKWVAEIKRQVEQDHDDEIYLIGHSLGSISILKYLEVTSKNFLVSGTILVSTPIKKTDIRNLDSFFEHPLDFKLIKSNCKAFCVIHGTDDTYAPFAQGKELSEILNCSLITIPNGGHLSGQEGWYSLPPCLDSLLEMMDSRSLLLSKDLLGKTVTVKVDRQLGTKHPKWGFEYGVNYGYIEDVLAPDGEELDAYILKVDEPVKSFTGVVVAIVHRTEDDDDKLIVIPKGESVTDEEIEKAIDFQEKWFKHQIIRQPH